MTFNASWVPDEDPQTLFSERCWLQGAIVSAAAYGYVACLYFMSLPLLVRRGNRVEHLRLLIYITHTFVLCTLFTVVNAIFTQMAFIDYRNYPGGPSAFENNMFAIPLDNVGNAAFVLSIWSADALLVWRFKIIYQSSRVSIWIWMPFPCLMLAASVAMGVMFLVQISTASLNGLDGVNFTLLFLSISLALNIILTLAIVFRLLAFKYRIVSALGPTSGGEYTSIIAMIVESAAIYSIVSVAFLVLLVIGNDASQVFLQSLMQIQAVATLLIVYRMAQGKGWTKDIATRMLSNQRSENVEAGIVFAWPSITSPSVMAASSGETDKTLGGVS